MERRFDTVVFDFDGTLADSLPSIHLAFDEALAACGRPPVSLERLRRFIGLPLEQIFLHVLPQDDRDVELCRTLSVQYRACYPKYVQTTLKPFAGLYPLIVDLRAAGVRLALASNKGRRSLDLCLAQLQLEKTFEIVLGIEDVRQGKPHPEALQRVAAQFRHPASRCLMVGDTVVDLEMAFRAGWPSCAVTFGIHPAERLRALPHDYMIDALSELVPLVIVPAVPTINCGRRPHE